MQKPIDTLFIIFGSTGDLTHRKLMPALYYLESKKLLPENFAIIGIARKEKTTDEYRNEVKESIKKYTKHHKEEIINRLTNKIYYFKNDFDTEQDYNELKKLLSDLDIKHNTKGNRIFYLATKPEHFENIIKNLKLNECIKKDKVHRIIIEKPFGHDLKSAQNLNKILNQLFSENSIYRIDHYLGKETVQNLLALRYSNRIFEKLWSNKDIEEIQISVLENIGIENRGNYYDNYGSLKDMIQNHLLQLVSLVTMENRSNNIKDIKKAKIEILKKVKIKKIILGQYIGYLEEKDVKKNSKTDTYSALKIEINNKRWKNVPIFIRTGKYLKRKASEIVIIFKKGKNKEAENNILRIRIQPDEGIHLQFNAKNPGNEFKLIPVSMDFCHECLFPLNTPEAYEKLIYDALVGDKTLFTSWEEVKYSWKIIDKITKKPKKIYLYEKFSWGPHQAEITKWKEPL
ncbi:MAG: glucose-6-phosphate dehydrogenase [Candidatus Woesearchaeota archaeon]